MADGGGPARPSGSADDAATAAEHAREDAREAERRATLPSPGWYIIGGGLLMIGMAFAGIGWSQRSSTIEEMQRLAMPARIEIPLPAGFTTLYVEGTDAPVACTLVGPGQPVVMRPTARPMTYDAAGYQGRSAFDFNTTASGAYTLACTGADRFTVAIGFGAGAAMALVYASIVPFLGGLLGFAIVARKRRRLSS